VEILRDTILGTVRRDRPDLSARQLAVLLICRLDDPPHTVRGLAETLNIAKPTITRAADRLEELGLAERRGDPRDRRSVLIVPTASGRAFVKELGDMMRTASKASSPAPTDEKTWIST
jgi:DNA-binding MarR family transcriptional regulator